MWFSFSRYGPPPAAKSAVDRLPEVKISEEQIGKKKKQLKNVNFCDSLRHRACVCVCVYFFFLLILRAI